MALIAMAVYSTEENLKDDCLEQTLDSLWKTVDFDKHRLILSVNGATDRTHDIIESFEKIISRVIINDENIGTAKAINKAWLFRQGQDNCIKMDDDIVIHQAGWIDEMEEAIRRDPMIGQIGLKRKDCWENVNHENPDYRSELIQLPHNPGEAWMVVEKAKHIIGSCVMHSAELLDAVGFLYQPSLYGYDDVIMSHRTRLAGFYSCFLPHIAIDHIDDGQTPFQGWKERHSGEQTQNVIALVNAMERGEKGLYFDSEGNQMMIDNYEHATHN